jgi:hypothetical protein
MNNRRGILYVTGAIAILVLPAAWVISSFPADASEKVDVPVAARSAPAKATSTANDAGKASNDGTTSDDDVRLAANVQLVRNDPMGLITKGWQRYKTEIEDYRFTLVKQERLGGELGEVQEIEVRYRKDPPAVYMLWKKNADGARRALRKSAQGDYVNKDGEALVRVEPNGAVARLFTRDIFVEMNGAEARKTSRRTIDEAGFGATFELLHKYNELAKKHGVLDMRYEGTSAVDGRPTFVIVRDLPYKGEKGPYPDARMVMHLDQEWLLPVAVYSYADHEEKKLLGRYIFTDVNLEPKFSDKDFEF